MSTITARLHRSPAPVIACMTLALASACGANSSAAPATAASTLEYPFQPSKVVVNDVQSSVPGLTPTQTAQGIGAVLFYAEQSMQPGDFKKVKNAFPGSDAMMNEGTKLGMPSEMYGLTSLSGSLKNIGISQDQLNQLVPAMTEVVSGKAGPEVAQKFAEVFKT